MTKPRPDNGGSAQPRRPWFRLHASTYVVLAALLILLVLANVPGQFVRVPDPLGACLDGHWMVESLEHGWPLAYLSRCRKHDLHLDWRKVWLPTADVERFSPLCLA